MAERSYSASRLESALTKVKRDLGSDAVIVSSRRVGGGFEVRAMSAHDAFEQRGDTQPRLSAAEGDLLGRLLERSGLDHELARALAAAAPKRPRTLGEASEALASALNAHLPFAAPLMNPGRRVIALVGPTGVGKTTSIAKLAAHTALVDHRKTALITLDGYRIGAVAQMQQYADLIGIPLEIAHDADAFSRSLRRLADADVIFVDTPGRGRRDKAAYGELAETLHSLDSEEEVEVSLCISATSREIELKEIIDRHAVLMPQSLMVTKLDEALSHDAVITAQVLSGLPLSWFTTGQRVPEDIESAGAERLAAALCGEEVFG